MPVELVGPERPKRPETCIVIFTAWRSLRLRSSKMAWVSSFFKWGILAGSFDMPTRRETLMRINLVGPKRPKTHVVVFLLRSVSRQWQETETKSNWWATSEYDTYNTARAKHDTHFAPAAYLGYHLLKACSMLLIALCPMQYNTDRWRCLSQCSLQRLGRRFAGARIRNWVCAGVFTWDAQASIAGKLVQQAATAINRA